MGLSTTDDPDKVKLYIIIVMLPVIAIFFIFAQNGLSESAFMLRSVSAVLETPEVAHIIGIEEGESEEDITENRMIIPLRDNYVRVDDSSSYVKNTEELHAKSASNLGVQSEPTALSTCSTQNPTAISASNFISPNIPSNTLDSNFDTRWSNKGVGSWIKLDLGSNKDICHVYISWFMGDARKYNFDISVSTDGSSFTNKFTGTSSGSTSTYEKYILPVGTQARYVKITVDGNDVTDYAAISEIRIFGTAATSSSCTKQPPTTISASGNDGNVPSNAVDNNLNTRWSNDGQGSWIQLDLGSKKSVCSVDIAWYRGDLRENNFVISVSDNGNTFTNKFTGTSSGSTTSFEKYTLPAGTEGRYVRITVNGNTENNFASITEIAVFGSTSLSGDEGTNSCNTQNPTAISSSNFISPHSPSNVIDNNFDTRWSNKGVGSWIKLDLGSNKNICHVYISWFMGDARKFNFDISVSTDGSSFTKKFTGSSSGSTSAYEKYILPADTEARYVKVTVNGNDVTDYAAISEIRIFGSASTTSGDAGTLDKFGIKKFYDSKINGEQWYLGDPGLITGGVTITKPSSYYETTSTQVRLRVGPPSSGYHPDQISTLNQNQLTSKGYMQSPYDWKNVEITGRFRVVSYTDSTTNGAAHLELSARGGTHTSSASCEGTAYHGNLYVTGRSKFEKELMHTGGYATNNPQKVGAVGPLLGKWFDFKHVIYTLPNGNIKVEQYYREYVNSQWSAWTKIFEHTDTGSWGGGTNNCGGTSNQMIKWGGPLVFFRWDNIDKMQFYNLSVREIVPP